MPELNNNRGNNRRRGRGNNSRPQGGGGGSGQQLNRIDSRARGNAPQLLEKYRKLAQDAHLNGDRVQAEYYLQFADHYFRVISDTRVRQEEQRQRQTGGVSGDRWQDQDGEDENGEFSVEGDFPAFDRAPSRRDEREPRENREAREPRESREPRENSEPRENREPDGRQRDGRDRGGRDRMEGRDQRRRFEPQTGTEENPPVETAPVDATRAEEREPVIDANDNPFVRDSRPSRGLRPRTDRRPRRDADTETAAFDPSSLPPSIGVRSEPQAETRAVTAAEPAPSPAAVSEDAVAPAPKKRGRPRKNPAPEAAE